MSSILQALKKIETDSEPQEGYTNWPKKIDTKTAINSGAKKRWYYRKYASFLLIGLLICILGVMIWAQRDYITSRVLSFVNTDNADETPHSANSKDSRIFRAKINPDQLPEANAARGQVVNEPRTPAGKQGGSVNKSAGLNKAGKRITSDNRPSPAQTASRPQTRSKTATTSLRKSQLTGPVGKGQTARSIDKDQPVRPVGRNQPVVPVKKRISPKAPPKSNLQASKAAPRTPARSLKPSRPVGKTKASPRKEVSYSRLEDASFKLQAIAWSTEAAKRLAVINGRIIREGESVDGYTVTQIRQEDVIVNDGSKSWLLEFGLKQ